MITVRSNSQKGTGCIVGGVVFRFGGLLDKTLMLTGEMRPLLVIEKFLRKVSGATSRCAAFLAYIRIGKGYGYPTCCVIHFAWDAVHQRPPGLLRGGIAYPDGRDTVWVPCGFHKGRHPAWRPPIGQGPRQLILFRETPEQEQERTHLEQQRILRETRRRIMWRGMFRNPG